MNIFIISIVSSNFTVHVLFIINSKLVAFYVIFLCFSKIILFKTLFSRDRFGVNNVNGTVPTLIIATAKIQKYNNSYASHALVQEYYESIQEKLSNDTSKNDTSIASVQITDEPTHLTITDSLDLPLNNDFAGIQHKGRHTLCGISYI